MIVRSSTLGACKLDVSGTVQVSKTAVSINSVQIRDLKARGIQAMTGVLRVYAPNGGIQEKPVRYENLDPHGINRFQLPLAQMDLSPPISIERVEGIVNGAYFADGSSCGENGAIAKSHFEDAQSDRRKDADEAIAIAGKLSPSELVGRLRSGLIPVGPYSRSTSAAFNQVLSSYLLTADGKLVPNYKTVLTELQRATTPAKQSHPTQSSQPRVQGTRARQKASFATSKGT